MQQSWWIAGVSMAAMAFGAPESNGITEPEIRVRLYDYAAVLEKVLVKAKNSASRIMEQAGVRVGWADCPLAEDAPPKDPMCGLPMTPTDLQLRILDPVMAKRVKRTRHCLGYALLADGFDSIASIFFHRAIELEKGNLVDRGSILGAALAHEMGHLLLEEARHAEQGILQAVWDDADLKLIAKGRCGFTPEQGRRILSMVGRRKLAVGTR